MRRKKLINIKLFTRKTSDTSRVKLSRAEIIVSEASRLAGQKFRRGGSVKSERVVNKSTRAFQFNRRPVPISTIAARTKRRGSKRKRERSVTRRNFQPHPPRFIVDITRRTRTYDAVRTWSLSRWRNKLHESRPGPGVAYATRTRRACYECSLPALRCIPSKDSRPPASVKKPTLPEERGQRRQRRRLRGEGNDPRRVYAVGESEPLRVSWDQLRRRRQPWQAFPAELHPVKGPVDSRTTLSYPSPRGPAPSSILIGRARCFAPRTNSIAARMRFRGVSFWSLVICAVILPEFISPPCRSFKKFNLKQDTTTGR